MIPLEDDEQKAFVQWLQTKKLLFFAAPNGAALKGNKLQRAIQMNRLKATGLNTGASDIVVFLDKAIVFVEMKRQKKKLKSGKYSSVHTKVSEDQQKFLNAVNGYMYAIGFVSYGAKDAIKRIESLMK